VIVVACASAVACSEGSGDVDDVRMKFSFHEHLTGQLRFRDALATYEDVLEDELDEFEEQIRIKIRDQPYRCDEGQMRRAVDDTSWEFDRFRSDLETWMTDHRPRGSQWFELTWGCQERPVHRIASYPAGSTLVGSYRTTEMADRRRDGNQFDRTLQWGAKFGVRSDIGSELAPIPAIAIESRRITHPVRVVIRVMYPRG
jgi:hypothetical protein